MYLDFSEILIWYNTRKIFDIYSFFFFFLSTITNSGEIKTTLSVEFEKHIPGYISKTGDPRKKVQLYALPTFQS